MSSARTMYLRLTMVRLVNAMLIQTWFVPDEFWQSTEIALIIAATVVAQVRYGYLTWEWIFGIRSYIYPMLFSIFYKCLHVVGMDRRALLIHGPRFLQALLAATGDLCLFLLSRRLTGQQVAEWTLLCQLLSWFLGYTCTRTLSNSTETVLVTAALLYFPWPGHIQPNGYTLSFVLLASLSVMVRPTSALLWAPLCLWHLHQCRGRKFWPFVRVVVTGGLSVLLLSTIIDRVWYGRWISVHLNFLQFNLISAGSSFYGQHAWHWYLSQALPAVLTTHTLPFVMGACRARDRSLLLLAAWHVFVLSFIPHKEFRFLMPVLPLAMHYCGVYFHYIETSRAPMGESRHISPLSVGCLPAENSTPAERVLVPELIPTSDNDRAMTGTVPEERYYARHLTGMYGSFRHPHVDRNDGTLDGRDAVVGNLQSVENRRLGVSNLALPVDCIDVSNYRWTAGRRTVWKVRMLVILLVAGNFPPLFYFSLIHQRGTIDVMNYLHTALTSTVSDRGQVVTASDGVLFLMPCHSTPYYSYLHLNVSMRFLTCEVDVTGSGNHTDEAEKFFQAPVQWLVGEYGSDGARMPSFVVYFDVLHGTIGHLLTGWRYRTCAKFFHSHFPEGRVSSNVFVGCRRPIALGHDVQ